MVLWLFNLIDFRDLEVSGNGKAAKKCVLLDTGIYRRNPTDDLRTPSKDRGSSSGFCARVELFSTSNEAVCWCTVASSLVLSQPAMPSPRDV